MLSLLAQAATTTPAAGTAPPQWFQTLNLLGPVAIGVIFLVVISGGGARKKTERERKALLDALKKGDRIRLIGGEYGAVVDVKDTKVLVKVDENSNTKIWYAREAVQSVEKDETAATTTTTTK